METLLHKVRTDSPCSPELALRSAVLFARLCPQPAILQDRTKAQMGGNVRHLKEQID